MTKVAQTIIVLIYRIPEIAMLYNNTHDMVDQDAVTVFYRKMMTISAPMFVSINNNLSFYFFSLRFFRHINTTRHLHFCGTYSSNYLKDEINDFFRAKITHSLWAVFPYRALNRISSNSTHD